MSLRIHSPQVYDRLSSLRAEKKMTQAEFSKKIGVSRTAYASYESGKVEPSVRVLKYIASIFNVTVDWLCGLSTEKQLENVYSLADCARMLMHIDRGLPINICKNSDNKHSLFFCPELYYDNKLCIAWDDFLADWAKMKNLLESDTIDFEVYSLWVEKTMKKLCKYDTSEETVSNIMGHIEELGEYYGNDTQKE